VPRQHDDELLQLRRNAAAFDDRNWRLRWTRCLERWPRAVAEVVLIQEQLVMNAAGALYRDALWRNATARKYVRGRGVTDWIMRSCGLGFADGRSLEACLRRHGGAACRGAPWTAASTGVRRRRPAVA